MAAQSPTVPFAPHARPELTPLAAAPGWLCRVCSPRRMAHGSTLIGHEIAGLAIHMLPIRSRIFNLYQLAQPDA